MRSLHGSASDPPSAKKLVTDRQVGQRKSSVLEMACWPRGFAPAKRVSVRYQFLTAQYQLDPCKQPLRDLARQRENCTAPASVASGRAWHVGTNRDFESLSDWQLPKQKETGSCPLLPGRIHPFRCLRSPRSHSSWPFRWPSCKRSRHHWSKHRCPCRHWCSRRSGGAGRRNWSTRRFSKIRSGT